MQDCGRCILNDWTDTLTCFHMDDTGDSLEREERLFERRLVLNPDKPSSESWLYLWLLEGRASFHVTQFMRQSPSLSLLTRAMGLTGHTSFSYWEE